VLPVELGEDAVCALYRTYSEKFRRTALDFTQCLRETAGQLQDEEESTTDITNRLVLECALRGGFNTLLAEKIIRLCDASSAEDEQKADA